MPPKPAVTHTRSNTLPGDDMLLNGWGGTSPSLARVATPLNDADVGILIGSAPQRGAIARGLGRAYSDAAQNAGGMVLDMTALSGVRSIDIDAGMATVGAGTSIDDLMRWLVPRGWFVPVTPGTRFVTVGGAIASDIHGKNHHADGTFGEHVHSLTLRTGSGDVLTLTPDGTPEAFWATVGGMGLTGVIIDATFDLIPIETSLMSVDEERCRDLDQLMTRMVEGDQLYRYSVAWIDCLARGTSLGRGILGQGNHATLESLPKSKRSSPHHFNPTSAIVTPGFVPSGLVNGLTIRAFNELWFRKARHRHIGTQQSIGFFFHPLDLVDSWNRMYGRRGFVQYQFVVPDGSEEAVRVAVERLSGAGAASFLAVLKRFGPQNRGMLSFPTSGWTLALDIPVGNPELGRLLDRLDDVVLDAGGRVYLSKDSRTRPEHLEQMYSRLNEFREARTKLDPDGVITSDLSRRLGL
ncbi:MAG: FAD-binding oxidoreductase [Acidimicrobiia bacterium]|nr:FAD-binding oxidoreductase [Acidimicrobiia bacterium]